MNIVQEGCKCRKIVSSKVWGSRFFYIIYWRERSAPASLTLGSHWLALEHVLRSKACSASSNLALFRMEKGGNDPKRRWPAMARPLRGQGWQIARTIAKKRRKP